MSHIRDYELIRLEGEEEIETIRFIFENDRRIVSNLIKQNTLKNTNLRQSLKIKITCCNSELIIVKLLETWYNLIRKIINENTFWSIRRKEKFNLSKLKSQIVTIFIDRSNHFESDTAKTSRFVWQTFKHYSSTKQVSPNKIKIIKITAQNLTNLSFQRTPHQTETNLAKSKHRVEEFRLSFPTINRVWTISVKETCGDKGALSLHVDRRHSRVKASLHGGRIDA